VAGRRRASRQRGKSDPIDALAVARVALEEGIDTLPVAQLEGPAREIKLLLDHREDLVAERTRIQNRLRWLLHDRWPELELPKGCLDRLFMAEKTASVHVSQVLAKLDVRTQTEAAAVAHRLGLADYATQPQEG
jgi:transposase